MSDIGSVIYFYQLDFLTPGNWPALANSRKCILHKPKLLMYPPFLPHIKHLLTIRLEYLGFLFDLAIVDFFGIIFDYFLIGNPICFKSSTPFSLFLAVVTTVTSNP